MSEGSRGPTRHSLQLVGLILVLITGCQTPRGILNPTTIRASTAPVVEQDTAMTRWRIAIDLANEFLASSFNRSLPADSRLRLDPEGMRLVTRGRTMPIKLILIDEYRDSSCVCATVDTHEDAVYVRRPWGASPELPIVTCNTFFSHASSMGDPNADFARELLWIATILFHEKAAHISSWEWFKCQKLEWLIGSGHHRISMQRPNAVTFELLFFWHGVEPATPTLQRILKAYPDPRVKMDRRSRETGRWQKKFEEHLRERSAERGPYSD